MRLDKFGIPVYSSDEIVEIIYKGKSDILQNILVDDDSHIQKYNSVSNTPLKIYQELDISIEDFDQSLQKTWFMPDEYQNMDIEGFLVNVCPKENYQRLIEELQEFRDRNMLDLLRWLKYFVDTCKKNQVIWGVGRGSSVASYVLFLIGVHRIDSIKYNLDWREFLR
jgi:DNA polymerase III alpha subunit